MGILCLVIGSNAFAERETVDDVKVISYGWSTSDNGKSKRCLTFTDQNNVVYYYDFLEDNGARTKNAMTFMAILIAAKNAGGTVSMLTDDGAIGACGNRRILSMMNM
jgi:hypothetical protein